MEDLEHGAHEHAPAHVALWQVPRLGVGHVLVGDEESLGGAQGGGRGVRGEG